MPYSYSEGRYVHDFPNLPDFEVERNLTTIATSRSGKGVTQIIPWLLENTDTNALVIDPKGEALEASFQKRSEHKKVFALDPFKTTTGTKSVIAKLNPLDHIDPSKSSAFREINVIADGLVMRHDPKAEHWDSGGVEVLAGFIAHVLTAPEYEGKRSLVTVRKLLTLETKEFEKVVTAMADNHACGNLPHSASSKLNNTGNEANHFISTATGNTKWLDDPDMAECLSSSTFNLREIKTKNIDIFLVLPVEAINDYGNFLRLFVRVALYHMQIKVGGKLKWNDVFFILDEAFSLGYISEIENSISAMPGFGLHLWTFWQDLNQIQKRYDKQGMGTFFANSDATYFFGVNDPDTAEFVSRTTGQIKENEIGVKPPSKPLIDVPEDDRRIVGVFLKKLVENPEHAQYRQMFDANMQQHFGVYKAKFEHRLSNVQAMYVDQMNEYQHARNVIGRPRITGDEVEQITKRNTKRKVCDYALVLHQGITYIQPLKAYFNDFIPKKPSNSAIEELPKIEMKLFEEIKQTETRLWSYRDLFEWSYIIIYCIGVAIAFLYLKYR